MAARHANARLVTRFIVTGARGFLGRAVVGALIRDGCDVVTASRSIAPISPAASHATNEALLAGDVMTRGDVVLHLAGIAHRGARETELREANVAFTARLAEVAARASIARFVFASSVKAAAEETHAAPLREDRVAEPTTAYGRAKRAAEEELARRQDFNWVALRLPLVHGPEARANMAALLRLAASPAPAPFAGLDNRRSVIATSAAAAALIAAARQHEKPGGIFYVADRPALSTAEIFTALREGLGRAPNLISAAPFAPLYRVGPLRMLATSLAVDDTRFRAAYALGPENMIDSAAALCETARAWRAGRGA